MSSIAFLSHIIDLANGAWRPPSRETKMTPNRTDHQQADESLPSKLSETNHRKILDDLLDTVRKQEDIMGRLLRDLEFFRNKFKTSLKYDSGAGDYREDMADGTEWDVRSYTDAGDGTLKEETTLDYIGSKLLWTTFEWVLIS
jgi:hypothetical protein